MSFSKKFNSYSKRKKRFLYFLYCLVILVIGTGSAEIILRAKGVIPWEKKEYKIIVEPGDRIFERDPVLGFIHRPGSFKITLPDGYSFRVTYLDDTLRITHPLATYPSDPGKEQIWIFGCSLTHGWSLNDEETYPWLLQQRLPDYEVVNFGVDGYGTLQSLLQFREALKQRKKPKIVIYAYISGHDARNTMSRSFTKQLVPQSQWGQWYQPYVRFDGEGKLRYSMGEIAYREFPLSRYSALAHYLENKINRLQEIFFQSHKISKILIQDFKELADKNGITFVVVGLNQAPRTAKLLKYLNGQGIPTGDISLDFKLLSNTNLPHDPHPGPAANRQFADKLYAFLMKSSFLNPIPHTAPLR